MAGEHSLEVMNNILSKCGIIDIFQRTEYDEAALMKTMRHRVQTHTKEDKEMKSTIKKLTLLLSVAVVALALAGCSQTAKPAATTVAPVAATPVTEAATANP